MDIKLKISTIILTFLAMVMPTQRILSQNPSADVGLRTVVIDPGHGGKDPGTAGPDRKNDEKHIVLKISRLLGEKIKKEYPEVKVVYTRNGDTFPKLTDRIRIAQENNADLFISIHCNANAKKTVSGSSAHILSRKDTRNPDRDLFDENLELTKLENSVIQFEDDQSSYTEDSAADQILNSLLFHANFDHSLLFAQLIVDNLAVNPFHKWGKGIHQNDFHLLKKMTCPAVLVETAFLSNPNERQLLVSPKWQEEISQRLFNAFKEYKTRYDATVSPASEAQISSEPSSEYYGIQIMGLGRLLKDNDPALKGLTVTPVKATDSSVYKYIYGTFQTGEAAKEALPAVRKKFPEAFVVKVIGTKVEIYK